MNRRTTHASEAAGSLGDVPHQLAALTDMSVSALADKHLALFGEPTRSRNREYLRKRLAWRIQELAEGGLTPRSLARIIELGDELPASWLRRSGDRGEDVPASPAPTPPSPASPAPTPPSPSAALASLPRDPRLPPVGTVLRRTYQGSEHVVAVLDEGFEYAGRRFPSLSAVAKQIAGTPWNGFTFFGLKATP